MSGSKKQNIPDDRNAAFDAYRSTSFFGDLNGLRFLCIALVLWHHAQPVSSPGLRLFDRGFLGVDFFFVLSGFLITTLLLREAHTFGKFSLKQFYLRRALRILPVYFFSVTIVSVYAIAIKGQTEYLEILPYYYLFLSNFLTEHIPTLSITWSLSVEEQYYLLWPLTLLLVPFRALPWVLLVVVCMNVAGAVGVFGDTAPGLGPLLFKLPDATYAPILLGSLVAMLLHRSRSFGVIYGLLSAKPVAPLAFASIVVLLQIAPVKVAGLPNLAIHLTMCIALISIVIRQKTMLSPIFRVRIISRIGEISYGVYLFHLLALDLTNRAFTLAGIDNPWSKLLIYSVLSCLIAELSFRTLEAYFRKFRPVRTVVAVRA